MRKLLLMFTVFFPFLFSVHSQNVVSGTIRDRDSQEMLEGVSVSLKGTKHHTVTDKNGKFKIDNVSAGSYLLYFIHDGYSSYSQYIDKVDGRNKSIYVLMLSSNEAEKEKIEVKDTIEYIEKQTDNEDIIIELSNEELISSDDDLHTNVSGILHGSGDVFMRTAGFTFGPYRFRLRGYDNKYSSLHMNGIQTNDLESGRAIWAYWGGLNDAVRNKESYKGISETDFTFGGIGGSTNIDTRASQIRKGTKLTYSFTNRNYHHRAMFIHNTGMMKNGWAFAFSGSRRFAEEGYQEGTFYDAWAYFTSIEKKFNDKHSLGLVVFGAPSKRGGSSGTTQEVYDITSTMYNPNWGWQDGRKRNARISDGHTPHAILTHYWDINKNSKLQTNFAYSKGKYNRTSLNWYDAADPRPDYYRYLPSYMEGDAAILERTREFMDGDRQLDWDAMYQANYSNFETIEDADGIQGNSLSGNRSQYIIEDRRNENDQAWFNTVYHNQLSEKFEFTAGIQHRYLKGRQYKTLVDLLGGDFIVDKDKYAERDFADISIADNDINKPNNIINEVGEVFGYDYNSNINKTEVWAQGSFDLNKFKFYLSGKGSYTQFWRTGNMQNGKFPDNSLGDSEKLQFTNYGAKFGTTYKISGKQFLHLDAAYMTKAPDFRNSFISARTRNQIVEDLTSETNYSIQGGYVVQAPKLKVILDVFYTEFHDQFEVRSFYFDLSHNFLNFVMTGIDKTHQGIEFGAEYTVLPGLSLTGVASLGYYRWASRPDFRIFIDNSAEIEYDKDIIYVEGNLVSGTPQTAFSGGIKYFAQKYWWIGFNINYLDDRYLAFSSLSRAVSSIESFSEEERLDPRFIEFIEQDKLPESLTLDAFIGKSFRFDYKYYLNISLNISNLLNNQDIITGGYEQARFLDNLDDLDKFPPKYYYAQGLQYYMNISFRF